MAMVSEKRNEEKRSEEKKRKEKTRYWLHAHGAGNFTQLLWLFPQGFHTHTKNEIILGTFFDMFGVLLASLSNETLDFEKHHRKTHDFGEKKRARSEKRRPWKEKATPNWEKDPSRKKKQKYSTLCHIFLQPRAPKLTSKWTPKSGKTGLRHFFSVLKKTEIFRRSFS